jgi:signal transduction histidine kinase/CheY-like chemotaxis protein
MAERMSDAELEFQEQSRRAALRLIADSAGRGRQARLIAGAVCALMSSVWLGPAWGIIWFAVLALFELGVYGVVVRNFVTPYRDTAPRRALAASAALMLAFSTVFTLGWAPAWFKAGSVAGFMAAMMAAGTFLHALNYYSTERLLFFLGLAPTTVVLIVAPVFVSHDPLTIMVSLMAAGNALATLLLSRADRNALVRSLVKNKSMRAVAEEANVEKSRFLATMSHELRTPLNAVIGYAEILEEDLSADGKAQGAADAGRIRTAARNLLSLINEVLDLSKIEGGRMEIASSETDILALMREAAEAAKPQAVANRNTLMVELDPALGVVMTDGPRLRQCVLHLLSNACKFTEGGEVRLSARLAPVDGEERLIIDVIDTGRGIAPEDAARLFKAFVQIDGSFTRRQGGAGLGLVITSSLARLLGGDVSFVSAPGQGSTFTLWIPARRPDIEANDERTSGQPPIIVIEDEVAARDLARRALARLPYEVRAAATAADGLDMARAAAPALIVLDIHLPDRLGWEVLSELKADPRLGAAPVLVVSIDDDRPRALALGAVEHLVKPVDREQLAAAVLRHALPPGAPGGGARNEARAA